MQLIDRALQVLEILSAHSEGMAITDLADRMNVPASSAHRIVNSLKDNHFVFQDKSTRHYRLSYKLFCLASEIQHSHTLSDTAKPFMKELSEEIDKTVVLCVKDENKVINLACIERRDSSMYMVKTGNALPLYSTSAGRVFLAFMNRDEALKILEHEKRTKTTQFTKTELGELNCEMDCVKEVGYALIDEELQMGIQGVACPVFGPNGEVVAAIAFTTLKTVNQDALQNEIDTLKKCAERLTREIS